MSVEISESLMNELVSDIRFILPDAEIHQSSNIITVTVRDVTRTIEVVGELFHGFYKTNNILESDGSSVSFEDTIRLPVTECFPFK